MADEFVASFSAAVDKFALGLPWAKGAKITPLPEAHKPAYCQEIVREALEKGASITNANGNRVDRTYVSPTVLYPVNCSMKVIMVW